MNAHVAFLFSKWSLALVCVWFGILKMLDMSPVKDIVFDATPFLTAIPYGFLVLGIVEVLMGVGLLFRRTALVAAMLVVIHLAIASLAVLMHGMAWEPWFPMLSVAGEFVIKNLVLIAVALMIVVDEREAQAHAQARAKA
ncbi:MAG: DUF417 family protein [bacterium]|nr:DUF417 family protein [bacterium]